MSLKTKFHFEFDSDTDYFKIKWILNLNGRYFCSEAFIVSIVSDTIELFNMIQCIILKYTKIHIMRARIMHI